MGDDVRIAVDERTMNGLRHALTKMDKESNAQLRTDVADIVSWYVPKIQSAILGLPEWNRPKQAQGVFDSMKAVRDRVPYAKVGGRSGHRFSGGAVPGQVLYGSEFGASKLKNFPPRSPRDGRGNAGWWIFPTLKRFQPQMTQMWRNAVFKVLDNW